MSILSLSKRLLKRDEQSGATRKATKGSEQKPKKAKRKKSEADAFIYSSVAADINLQPVFTEKGFTQQSDNVVVFQVRPQASKGEIARAIQEKYGTTAVSIRTATFQPKVRRRGVTQGRTNHWKKAYVKVEDMSKFTG